MRRSADPLLLEQQRFNAARMSDQGIEPKVIAASLGFDDQTVRRWLRAYRRGGMEALKAKVHPGPTPRMTDAQEQQLLALLERPPPDAYAATDGLAGQLWTAAKIATLIKGRFGVCYHPSHVGQMMHDLDYSQQLPHKRPRERDQAKVDRWLEEQWPRIVRRAIETAAVIVFVDESGFLMNPLRKKVWAKRGHTPELLHRTRNHAKVSVIGGLVASSSSSSSSSSSDDVRLLTQWHPGESVDQTRVVQFLERLLKECPGNVIVVWDNLPAHRSKLVKAFCAAHRELWLENLPGYAPDLNPIELVWCMSKYHRLANHGVAELEQLHQAAQQATDEVAREQDLLKSCIRHAGLADALYQSGDQ
jgi:transposase